MYTNLPKLTQIQEEVCTLVVWDPAVSFIGMLTLIEVNNEALISRLVLALKALQIVLQ